MTYAKGKSVELYVFFISLVFEILNLFQTCETLVDYLKTLLPLFVPWMNLNVQSQTQTSMDSNWVYIVMELLSGTSAVV